MFLVFGWWWFRLGKARSRKPKLILFDDCRNWQIPIDSLQIPTGIVNLRRGDPPDPDPPRRNLRTTNYVSMVHFTVHCTRTQYEKNFQVRQLNYWAWAKRWEPWKNLRIPPQFLGCFSQYKSNITVACCLPPYISRLLRSRDLKRSLLVWHTSVPTGSTVHPFIYTS